MERTTRGSAGQRVEWQDKERKRMEMVGKKIEIEAATQWRIANFQALRNRYAQDNFNQVSLADNLQRKS